MNRPATSLALMLGACLAFTSTSFAQIQLPISCPTGHSYWDTPSILVMNPGLATNHHMKGFDPTTGNPALCLHRVVQSNNRITRSGTSRIRKAIHGTSSCMTFSQDSSQGYIYQWVTELDTLNGVNHWSDPTSCRKHNNGSGSSTADLSYPVVARCAAPGGENSSFWVAPPPAQPFNTQYYTYVNGAIQPPQNLQNSLMELKGPGGPLTLYWGSDMSQPFSVNTLIFQYTYSCSQQNVKLLQIS